MEMGSVFLSGDDEIIVIDPMNEYFDIAETYGGMDMYYAEQIVLGAEDMKGVDFAPISEGQLPSSLKENGGRAR